MNEPIITLTMTKSDAEVLLGVLAAERHNPDVEEVCDALRQQIDEQLAQTG